MKRLLYYIITIAILASCADEDLQVNPYEFLLKPHNSNYEFYAGVPVSFTVKEKGQSQGYFYEMELFVDGKRVDVNMPNQQYSFDAGTYKIKANIKSNNKLFEIDTSLNIVEAPPEYGAPNRGERVEFGWTTEAGLNILLGTYYGSSALDYQVLTINESLRQQGGLLNMSLQDVYPDFFGHGASSSGTLVIGYNQTLAIYNASLTLQKQIYFNHDKSPRKILVKEDNAILMFDSMSHITLKKLDLNTSQLDKGQTKFVGVEDMTLYNYFLVDEKRVVTYYLNKENTRSLLMGIQIGSNIEFVQYFQPPIFISELNSISTGGFIFTNYYEQGNKISVIGTDASGVVLWTRTLNLDYENNRDTFDFRIRIKELNGFVYIFFDNMRCAKFSLSGTLVWDKYFYSDVAQFKELFTTSNGEFVMVGTRLQQQTIDYLLRSDIVAIKINSEGFRVVM